MTSEYQKVLAIFDENIIKPDFFPDAVWIYSMDQGELTWNTDSDVEDLEDGIGETYSLENMRDYVSWLGYSLFTGYDHCGDKYQIILKDANRHG